MWTFSKRVFLKCVEALSKRLSNLFSHEFHGFARILAINLQTFVLFVSFVVS